MVMEVLVCSVYSPRRFLVNHLARASPSTSQTDRGVGCCQTTVTSKAQKTGSVCEGIDSILVRTSHQIRVLERAPYRLMCNMFGPSEKWKMSVGRYHKQAKLQMTWIRVAKMHMRARM